MYKKTACLIIALILVAFQVNSVFAEDQKASDKKKKETKAEVKEEIKETFHQITIDGRKIEYKATAGMLAWKKDDEDPKAKVFYIAYSRTDNNDPGKRPITFSFNGGPGSSSVWLHLGLLGPRRVLMHDDGSSMPPPFQLTDNEYSLLDKTDLVFIDPVGTGYSRAVEGEDPKQFHGVNEDIEAVGEFIRLYLSKNERWASPKFLIGESYGTLRAAGLAGYLQSNHGMYLNGIMLVSSILNYQTARFNTGNDLPYILFLPTYTATAWYHKQLKGELQSELETAVSASEEFARGEYASALMLGDAIEAVHKSEIVKKLSLLTGLSEEYIEQSNMRIKIWRFVKELLRDERRTVGRLDSRFKGIDSEAAGDSYEYDPSYAVILGAFSTTLNDYIRRELKFESDLPYEILTGKVHPWSYKQYQNRYVNTSETLREAMTKNRDLKVFVASGYYDLATPFFATKYTFDHLGLDASLRNNVTMKYYEAGHMMYINKESLIQIRLDLVSFIDGAVKK